MREDKRQGETTSNHTAKARHLRDQATDAEKNCGGSYEAVNWQGANFVVKCQWGVSSSILSALRSDSCLN